MSPLLPPLGLAHEQARELCSQVARISVQICNCQPAVGGQNKNFHQPLRPNYQICSRKIQRTSVLGKQRCEKLSIDSISLANILTLSFPLGLCVITVLYRVKNEAGWFKLQYNKWGLPYMTLAQNGGEE